MYSFGVVALEIITGRPVIIDTDENDHISKWVASMLEKGDIKNIVDPGIHGDFEINSAWKAVEIAMECISFSSSQRPTMNRMVKELKECLAMETARTGRHGFDSEDQQGMMTVNLNTELSPLAR